MNEYDVVILIRDLPEEGLKKWSVGAILEIYDENYCEVEISDKNGITQYLGALPKNCLEVIWENVTMKYVGRVAKLLCLLDEIRTMVNSPNTDFTWSSFNNEKEFIREYDLLIEDFKRGMPGCIEKLNLLFAPTGDLQEISINSGWGEKFIEISSKFDDLAHLQD